MDSESTVERLLADVGYSVTKIAKGNKESPDFFVHDDASSYVIELKTKFPSDKEIRERREVLLAGDIHQINEPMVRKNTLSGIIRKAKDQLREYSQKDDIFRLVWLFCTGHLANPRMEQFEATLYGSATIVDWADDGRSGECYFFYTSDFYRYRQVLDGAIVSSDSEGNLIKAKLLLNPLSPRYEKMKESSLQNHFQEQEAVLDPIVLENEQKAFLVTGDVDRDNRQAVLDYLREKYKLTNIHVLEMKHMSGTKIIPTQLSDKADTDT